MIIFYCIYIIFLGQCPCINGDRMMPQRTLLHFIKTLSENPSTHGEMMSHAAYRDIRPSLVLFLVIRRLRRSRSPE